MTTTAATPVERKLHRELRERIAQHGYHVARFYRVYAPEPDGVVEVLFRGYPHRMTPPRVGTYTALVTGDAIGVCSGW